MRMQNSLNKIETFSKACNSRIKYILICRKGEATIFTKAVTMSAGE